MRNKSWGLGLLLSVVASACGAPVNDGVEESTDSRFGALELPLVSPGQDSFRLRAAIFEITSQAGALVTSLDSEQDPDALELRATLPQDSYAITLGDGWALERLAEDGTASPVNAALLTANPLGFEIENAQVTELVYAFTTDEGVIRLGQGEVSVSVAVTPSEALPSCDVLDASSCSAGQTCLLANQRGRTFCAQPGSLPVGSACSSEQCVAGAQCLTLAGEEPEQALCREFCSVAAPRSGCNCQSVDFDSDIGVCTEGTTPPPPPGDVPAQCTPGVDPGPEASPWVVCEADEASAWVSADSEGFFHVDRICQSLGYTGMSQFGGTCGNVCGYCEEPTSCEAPGERLFDGEGECGVDELGLQLCLTVMWECVR